MNKAGLLGADGAIDALALSVVRENGNPRDVIMALRDRQHVRLDDGRFLLWHDRHVCSSDGDSRGIVTRLDDNVIIAGGVLSAPAGMATVDRPITDLLEHSTLSSDMLIEDVRLVAGPEPQASSGCGSTPG